MYSQLVGHLQSNECYFNFCFKRCTYAKVCCEGLHENTTLVSYQPPPPSSKTCRLFGGFIGIEAEPLVCRILPSKKNLPSRATIYSLRPALSQSHGSPGFNRFSVKKVTHINRDFFIASKNRTVSPFPNPPNSQGEECRPFLCQQQSFSFEILNNPSMEVSQEKRRIKCWTTHTTRDISRYNTFTQQVKK